MTFQHWASVTLYTSACALAQCCVFDKQFPDPFLCGLPPRRVGPPSCERTGLTCLVPSRPFSRAPEVIHHAHLCQFWYGPRFAPSAFLGTPAPGFGHKGLDIWLSRRAKEFARWFDRREGAGILTCCPSTTPFGLVLGPGSPWADLPSPGNLGHSAGRILTCLIVTQAGIFTCWRSTDRLRTASRPQQRSPTALLRAPTASAPRLFPIIIGARVLDQ
jgi:hypothetical protein